MRLLRQAHFVAEAVRAIAVLLAIEAGLRGTDLRRTCRWLRLRVDLASTAPAATGAAVLPGRARRAVRAHLAVVSRWPAGDTCLRRCLLVGHRLCARDPVLRIGVTRSADGAFAAHSWLEIGDATLDPGAAAFGALGAIGR